MLSSLRNRNAILTGGSRGLGPLIAEALAAEGINLALVARTPEPLEEVASRFPNCVAIPADLSDTVQVETAVAEARAQLGDIDILINNAGVEHGGSFRSRTSEELEQVIATNLTAPVLLSRLLLPGMLERGQGHIVTIASLAGKIALPYAATYSGTKAALTAWSQSLAIELAGTGVSSSVVNPGFVSETGMFASHGIKAPAYLSEVSPRQVVAAVLTALKEGPPEIVVSGRPFKPLAVLHAVAPQTLQALMRRLGLFDFLRKHFDR